MPNPTAVAPLAKAPNHVAIIMDGNGRWAQQRGRPRLFGHHAGARRVREILKACPESGVKYLTLFAFSTENWNRTPKEIDRLFYFFKFYLLDQKENLLRNGVRLETIGDLEALPDDVRDLFNEIKELTREGDKLTLIIGIVRF